MLLLAAGTPVCSGLLYFGHISNRERRPQRQRPRRGGDSEDIPGPVGFYSRLPPIGIEVAER
jgi:hypothetical protein